MAQATISSRIGESIPIRSVPFFLICFGGLSVFVYGGVISSYRAVSALDREASALRLIIDENNSLVPIRQSVMRSLQQNVERGLPLPEKKPLARGESAQIFSSISELANKSGMKLIRVIPDQTLLASDSEFLPVDIAVSGDFHSFRGLLVGLGGLPYLDDVAGIEIRDDEMGTEYNVSLRLALGK